MLERLLSKNTACKLIAIFLALILWFNAWDQKNPIIEEVYSVALEARGLPSTLVLAELPSSIQVKVEGRKSAINEINSRDFSAFLDLEDIREGRHEVKVEVEIPPGVHLVNLIPSKVWIRIDEQSSIQLPIRVEVAGRAAPGYKALDPVVEPGEVIIGGPKSLLNKVESALVQVNLKDNREDYVQTLPVILDGEGLEGKYSITVSPEVVKVFVPVVRDPDIYRAVPIEVNLTGEPAPGCEVVEVSVKPEKINISGTRGTPDMIEYISTSPVDIEGLEEDLSTSVGLDAPESMGLEVTVDVLVKIEKIGVD